MLIWVIYDISKNKTRSKVERLCKNAGLYRVQKSVFLGEVTEAIQKEFKITVEELIDQVTDSVYIFPMNRQELKKARLLGQAFDKGLVTDEVISMFF